VGGATAVLTTLGDPGRLSAAAQRALAGCLADSGSLDQAGRILGRYVSRRLPAFQAARRDYEIAIQRASDSLLAGLRQGEIPPDLEAQLQDAAESDQPMIAQRWIGAQLEDDARLSQLRGAYERRGEVVPAVLSLGMIELRQANESAGAERERHLDAAERHFLSIQAEAEGVPEYHLGLGQVYHRLGRAEDGERELSGLLARGDAGVDLAVAHAYRELGLVGRARQVAESLYERGGSAGAGETGSPSAQAATLLALMADGLEDEELWLGRAPQDDAFVRISLIEVRARRHMRDGQLTQAADLFGEAAGEYERMSGHSAAATNNAALDYQSIYLCTGAKTHLDRAVEGLEKAYRMAPDNALSAINLAELHAYSGTVTVLERWVRTADLRLSRDHANLVASEISSSSSRQALADAFRADPSMRRALELSRQAQTLAPGNPQNYVAETVYFALTDDTEGSRRVRDRLGHVEGLDTSAADRARQRFESGDDAALGAFFDSEVSACQATLTRARRTHHAPTLAAALLMTADALMARSSYRGTGLEDIEDAIAALREAERAWPELDVESSLAWALVQRAVMRELARCEPLAQAWRDDMRTYGVSLMLHRVTSGPAAEEVLAALRGAPELAEAVALVRAPVARPRTVSDWVLARLAGDAQLEAEAARDLVADRSRLFAEIGARLSNGDASSTLTLEILRSLQPGS
jgi:tetratricopeptide (TPR) repeat protein